MRPRRGRRRASPRPAAGQLECTGEGCAGTVEIALRQEEVTEELGERGGVGGVAGGGAGGLLHGGHGARQVAVELAKVGSPGQGGGAGPEVEHLLHVTGGLVVAAELDAGIDEDAERVAARRVGLVGGDTEVVGAIEVVERQGQHAVDAEGARVVAGEPAGFTHGELGHVVGRGVAGAHGLLGGQLGEREPGAGVVGRGGHTLLEGGEALLVGLDPGWSGLVASVTSGGEEAGDRDRRGGECRRHDEDPADPEGTTGASPGCDGRAHVWSTVPQEL